MADSVDKLTTFKNYRRKFFKSHPLLELISCVKKNSSYRSVENPEVRLFMALYHDDLSYIKNDTDSGNRLYYYLMAGWDETALSDWDEDIRMYAREALDCWEEALDGAALTHSERIRKEFRKSSLEEMSSSSIPQVEEYAAARGVFRYRDPYEVSLQQEDLSSTLIEANKSMEYCISDELLDRLYKSITANQNLNGGFEKSQEDRDRIVCCEQILNLRPSLERISSEITELAYYDKNGYTQEAKSSQYYNVQRRAVEHLGYSEKDFTNPNMNLQAYRVLGYKSRGFSEQRDNARVILDSSFDSGSSMQAYIEADMVINGVFPHNPIFEGGAFSELANTAIKYRKDQSRYMNDDEIVAGSYNEEVLNTLKMYTLPLEEMPLHMNESSIANQRLELGI